MIKGSDPAPEFTVNNVASTTADSGSLSTATTAAPRTTATAGVVSKPGSCAANSPAAAPRNIAGNVGPPRKVPTEMPYARPLKAITRISADTDQAPRSATSGPSAL